NDVAGGGHQPGPRRRNKPVLPLDLARLGLNGPYGAIAGLIRDRPSSASSEAEAWFVLGVRAEIPVPLLLRSHLVQPRLRVEARRIPVLAAGYSRPNRQALPRRKLVRNPDRPALGVNFFGPSLLHKRMGRNVFPGDAVEHIEKTVAVGPQD